MIGRRGFVGFLAAALCAPAIIRPGLLMPTKRVVLIPVKEGERFYRYQKLELLPLGSTIEDLPVGLPEDWLNVTWQQPNQSTGRYDPGSHSDMASRHPDFVDKILVKTEMKLPASYAGTLGPEWQWAGRAGTA